MECMSDRGGMVRHREDAQWGGSGRYDTEGLENG